MDTLFGILVQSAAQSACALSLLVLVAAWSALEIERFKLAQRERMRRAGHAAWVRSRKAWRDAIG